jgi:hypothetical protein
MMTAPFATHERTHARRSGGCAESRLTAISGSHRMKTPPPRRRSWGITTWVAAAVFLPLVLVYQLWTYRVFPSRIGVRNTSAGP